MDIATRERQYFFSRLLWLFPAVFLLHILEESTGFSDWVANILGGTISIKAFYVNNAIFFAILVSLMRDR